MSLPIEHPEWQGDPCCMCEGAGEYLHAISEPNPDNGGITHIYVGHVSTGLRCPACNGHGKEPS